MPYYRELNGYKKIGNKLVSLIAYLQKNTDREAFHQKNNSRFARIRLLTTVVNRLYRKNQRGNYPGLYANDLNQLKSLYTEVSEILTQMTEEFRNDPTITNKNTDCFTELQTLINQDKEIVDKVSFKDGLPLPEAVYKLNKEITKGDYANTDFKEPGFREYEELYASSGLTHDQLLARYIRLRPDQVMDDLNTQVGKHPRLYEYRPYSTSIPPYIQHTGNPELINNYISNNGDNLLFLQKYRLLKHAQATEKKNQIQNEAATEHAANRVYGGPRPRVIVSGPEKAEIRIHQPAKQSSSQGCWSVTGQLLLQSRGITNVSQEEIRAFRQDINADNLDANAKNFYDYNYGRDMGKNLMDMGDSILAFAPNSMLHETMISPYDRDAEKAGISAAQYVENTAAFFRKSIMHAITVDKSPVSLLKKGHFITIFAINGDTVSYKDSNGLNGPDATYTMSVKDYIKNIFVDSPDKRPLQFNWISDIRLAKDGRTLHGVPSKYSYMKEDGTVQLPPAGIQDVANGSLPPSNKLGVKISRMAGDEDKYVQHMPDPYTDGGIRKNETVYLPPTLNAQFLKNQAEARSTHEEEVLKQADREFYRMDPRDHILKQENAAEIIESINRKVVPRRALIQQIQQPIDENVNDHSRYKRIMDTTAILYNDVSQGTRFYYVNAKPSYGELKDSLDIIRGLAKRGWKHAARNEGTFTEADLNRMNREINKAIKSARTYLDAKYDEMMQNPARRNADGGTSTEQVRIRATVKALENLMQLKASLKQNETAAEAADRLSITEQYRSALISDADDPKKQQLASYKPRIAMPVDLQYGLTRIEALFGKNPEKLHEFDDKFNYSIGNANIKHFRTLKTIDYSFPAIGEKGKLSDLDVLSDRDFAAVSYASISQNPGHTEILLKNPLESLKKFEAPLQKARLEAQKALNAYKRGKKTPLALLLKQGINNLSEQVKAQENESAVSGYTFSEMSRRMLSMLERDPDLMKIAVNNGLRNENIAYIKAMETEGLYALKQEQWNKEITEIEAGRKNAWTQEERLERYTDLLIHSAYSECRNYSRAERDNGMQYVNACETIEEQASAFLVNKINTLFRRVERDLSKDEFLSQKIAQLKTRIEHADAMENPTERRNAIQNGVKFFFDCFSTAKTNITGRINFAKAKIVLDQGDLLNQYGESRREQGLPELTNNEKFEFALKKEKQYLDTARDKTSDGYISKKNNYDSYINQTRNFTGHFDEMQRAENEIKTYLEITVPSMIREAKVANSFEEGFITTMARPGENERLRTKVREYIMDKNLTALSEKDFVDSMCRKGEMRQANVLTELQNHAHNQADHLRQPAQPVNPPQSPVNPVQPVKQPQNPAPGQRTAKHNSDSRGPSMH